MMGSGGGRRASVIDLLKSLDVTKIEEATKRHNVAEKAHAKAAGEAKALKAAADARHKEVDVRLAYADQRDAQQNERESKLNQWDNSLVQRQLKLDEREANIDRAEHAVKLKTKEAAHLMEENHKAAADNEIRAVALSAREAKVAKKEALDAEYMQRKASA